MDVSHKSSSGMLQDYMSIDDILMSSERLPSVFLVPVKGLGFLDASTNKKDIAVGTKMDLPLWLVLSLAHPRKKFISFDYTKPYKGTYREILKADASVVDLHKIGPFFYAFGQQLLTLNHNESLQMAKCLVLTFMERFRKIMDWSINAYEHDNSERQEKLDEVERNLFKLGQKSLQSFQQWEMGESRKLSSSELVSRHRKRKRDMSE
ncbi:DNA replication complex GINS protein PSF3-like [Clavelina lepadiformis]|uniref:DNA replication complex GINS protein PSF3-like n=1 Tax=Clavelina lepadiformis TaxID=159417 RepID=UPI004042E6CF